MAALKKIFGNWWVVSILIAVILALILVLLAPLVIGFLRPWWVRLICGGVIAAVWGGLAVWRLMTAKKSSDALAEGLKAASGGGEDSVLAQRVGEAMATLKSASGKQKDYLYSRPWYVIIGPPGAGKTTALLNSGLRFPFDNTVLKGAGGTRNLDFWFADEAVFVDTAGRYTTQDSGGKRDADAWAAVLALLKKNRPSQPVNGVLVTIGLDSLLSADLRALDEQASLVRQRAAELQAALEISVPVYVIFSKADLIAGFSEFFEDLDVEGRRSVLGATLPYRTDTTPDESELITAFDDLAMSLEQKISRRLEEELDARRRGVIMGFPGQISALRARIIRFMGGAFPQSEAHDAAHLRGFYFASGVQTGTPFDRLLGDLASLYETKAPVAEKGRAYFINRLLTEVVIGEGGLVRSSKAGNARQRLAMTGWLIGIAAVCALVIIAWGVSFFLNASFMGKLKEQTAIAATQLKQSGVDMAQARAGDAALTDTLPALQTLRDLPQGQERYKKGAPFFMGFGLYRQSHSRLAQQTYLTALSRTLLPHELLRLEEVLRDPNANALTLYPALKVYLLLGGQKPEKAGAKNGDSKDRGMEPDAIKAWIMTDLSNGELAGDENDDARTQVSAHLDAMLADPNLNQVWGGTGAAPLDADLISTVRGRIQQMSLTERAYAILLQGASGDGQDWQAGPPRLDSGAFNAFADPGAIRNMSVPYIYTREGYLNSFQKGLKAVEDNVSNDKWVLGDDEDSQTMKQQLGTLRDDVTRMYADDYIKTWNGAVTALKPADYFSDVAARSALAGSNSPIKVLFDEISRNTTFAAGDNKLANAGMAALKKKIPGPAKALVASGGGAPVSAGQIISDNFKELNSWTKDGLPAFLTALRDAVKAFQVQSTAGGGFGAEGAAGAAQAAQAELGMAAQGAPAMAQAFTAAASQQGSTATTTASQGALADAYARTVAVTCQAATTDKYPFLDSATDNVSVDDMRSVFGHGGSFDALLTTRLNTIIDKGPIWQWTPDPLTAGLNPASPAQLQKADKIRAFVDSNVQGTIELVAVEGSVTKAEMSMGGQTYSFGSTSDAPKDFSWAPGTVAARVVLNGASGPVTTVSETGPWSLLRLVSKKYSLQNDGDGPVTVQYGDGANFARFRITVSGDINPFKRGELWSFHCPNPL